MGLNYVKRPRRTELDPPNDFITVALGREYGEYKEHGPELIIDFENKQLDRVHEKLRNLDFLD